MGKSLICMKKSVRRFENLDLSKSFFSFRKKHNKNKNSNKRRVRVCFSTHALSFLVAEETVEKTIDEVEDIVTAMDAVATKLTGNNDQK